MNHVFYRHTRFQPPVAARGDGVYIVDSDGKRYLDASGGAARGHRCLLYTSDAADE